MPRRPTGRVALQDLENPIVIWHSDFHAHGLQPFDSFDQHLGLSDVGRLLGHARFDVPAIGSQKMAPHKAKCSVTNWRIWILVTPESDEERALADD